MTRSKNWRGWTPGTTKSPISQAGVPVTPASYAFCIDTVTTPAIVPSSTAARASSASAPAVATKPSISPGSPMSRPSTK